MRGEQKYMSLLLLLVALCGWQCSPRRLILNQASGIFESALPTIYQEDDLELAEQFFSANLKTIEIVLAKDPTNRKLNLLAGQAFGAYAMAFVEDQDPERAQRFYQRGLKYALAGLPTNITFGENVRPAELEEILKQCRKADVPVLFWIGYNWGSFILHNLDSPKTIANLAKVEMIMHRILELDETYNFGGVHLFYGNYYAARPPLLGGNPEKGREHYLRNMELNRNQFLLTNFFYARYYAVQVQDRTLFDKLLTGIVDFDLEQVPDLRLFNALAQQKARRLLAEAEIYFSDDNTSSEGEE